jgi:hypothetical protein
MLFGMMGVRDKRGRVAFWALPQMIARCNDCDRGLWDEWFMVRKPVWERVSPGTSQKSVHEPMPMKYFLCIGCLEERLGRKLKRRDFDLRRPMNHPGRVKNRPMSRRWRNRLQPCAQ